MAAEPLTVAIDVTPAAVPEPSGIAIYIDRLVRALPRVDPGARYLSCYRLFRLLRLGRVPVAAAPNAERALYDERVPLLGRPRADIFHGADIRLPERARCPLVATIHDLYSLTSSALDPPGFAAKRTAQYERAVRAARIVITHSEHVRAEVIDRLGAREEQVRAIPLGVDGDYRTRPPEEVVAALAPHGLAPQGYALAVGLLSGRKNPIGALRAISRLRERGGPRLKLAFAGKDHDQAAAVRAEARRLGLEDAVRLLGYVPPRALPALYAGARALLLLSLDEGFGLPVLEAFASGVPVVAARRGAIPEVAGGCALLVEPEDADAAAAALGEACAEGSERGDRIARGLVRARAFTWDETARRTAEVYRAALAAPAAPRVPPTLGGAA